jgi:hypothetical protein
VIDSKQASTSACATTVVDADASPQTAYAGFLVDKADDDSVSRADDWPRRVAAIVIVLTSVTAESPSRSHRRPVSGVCAARFRHRHAPAVASDVTSVVPERNSIARWALQLPSVVGPAGWPRLSDSGSQRSSHGAFDISGAAKGEMSATASVS